MNTKKILVVEDERLIAEDIKRTLQFLGYEVPAIIVTGLQAIEETKIHEPDLILMDIMLEGDLDGIEAAKIIHQDQDIPIIFLTAFSNKNTLEAATGAEPYGYILKPFGEKELQVTIKMALYKHGLQKILKENEKKYRAIFENANEAICIIQENKFRFMNPQTIEFLGFDKENIIDKIFLDFVYKNDKQRVEKLFNDVLNGKNPGNQQTFRMLDKDKNILWIKANTVLIDWEGKPSVLNFLSNVTQQILVEEEIRKLKVIADNANYGITISDINGEIQYINKYYSKIHGYEPESIIGKNSSIFHNQEQLTHIAAINKELFDNGSFNAVELWHTHKDGTVFPMLMNSVLIHDTEGSQKFIAASAIDVTDRKKSEKIQKELLQELEDVNSELQNFAYVVSHDLKAPLRAISALANWISTDYEDVFNQEGKEQLRLLINRVKRMHDLIDGILEYSRVGRIKEEKIEIDLNSLLNEVIDAIAPPANIKITIKNKLPLVIFERNRITQVFQNLLSNAIKFMDKPRGEISVSCEGEKNFWKFSIIDNGPGIDEKHFLKIFKIFQTLHPRDEFESTGIGLTLIKKIINMYGGQIWLESTLGKGTSFYFTLPKT